MSSVRNPSNEPAKSHEPFDMAETSFSGSTNAELAALDDFCSQLRGSGKLKGFKPKNRQDKILAKAILESMQTGYIKDLESIVFIQSIGIGAEAKSWHLQYLKNKDLPNKTKNLSIRVSRSPDLPLTIEGQRIIGSETAFLQSFLFGNEEYTVSRHIPGRTLGYILHRINKLKDPAMKRMFIARQCWPLFKVLNANRFLHLDISLNNLIVTPEGRVKAIDTSEAMALGDKNSVSRQDETESFNTQTMRVSLQTTSYLPPEALKNSYTLKANVFQLACVLYSIFAGKNDTFTSRATNHWLLLEKTPFYRLEKHEEKICDLLESSEYDKIIMNILRENIKDDKIRDLIYNMSRQNPEDRLSFKDARSQFNQIFQEKVLQPLGAHSEMPRDQKKQVFERLKEIRKSIAPKDPKTPNPLKA